jgi:hypothetical protein
MHGRPVAMRDLVNQQIDDLKAVCQYFQRLSRARKGYVRDCGYLMRFHFVPGCGVSKRDADGFRCSSMQDVPAE